MGEEKDFFLREAILHALIDGDILLYEFGSAKNEDGTPLKWPFVISRLDARLANILNAVNATSHQIYLTGKGNFREKIATIQPYKGHRPSEKPYWHAAVKDFLIKHRNALLVEGYEADDAMAMAQHSSKDTQTVICSRDKDLNMVGGWHYQWPSGTKAAEYWKQDKVGGNRCLTKQMLTGDTTDNIPGLYGVGAKSALLKKVDELENYSEMAQLVAFEYERRFGAYWPQFYWENYFLLNMAVDFAEIRAALDWSQVPKIPEAQLEYCDPRTHYNDDDEDA